jgi:hypothetical protein
MEPVFVLLKNTESKSTLKKLRNDDFSNFSSSSDFIRIFEVRRMNPSRLRMEKCEIHTKRSYEDLEE